MNTIAKLLLGATLMLIVVDMANAATWICTSKQFANIWGRKRCGPHKARLVLKEGIAASYRGFSKAYQRKVLRSYECKEVSGV